MSPCWGRYGGGGGNLQLLHTLCSGVGYHGFVKPSKFRSQELDMGGGGRTSCGVRGTGLVYGRSAQMHTSSGGRAGLNIRSSVAPLDRRPSELDAVSEVKKESVALGTQWNTLRTCLPGDWGMGVCHSCPQARGHVCVLGGGGGRCRTPWLGGQVGLFRNPSL